VLLVYAKLFKVIGQQKAGEGGFCQEIFCGGEGVQQIQLRTEGKQNVDPGKVAP
jgi:hypothetical protein